MITELSPVDGSSGTLSDGTRLDDLFDFQRHRMSARVFSDPEIHKLEMSQIFGRTWLFVGFESEIPNPGDFVLRPMGDDSVIVNRGSDGSINILLNRCTHRGVQLCMIDYGSGTRFRCPYHGFTFGSDGRLVAMPSQDSWSAEAAGRSDLALRKARVATRGGLIFGTWNAEIPGFDEYLGEFAFYFDSIFCAVDDDLVPVGPPQRWALPFDWKIGTENSIGDGYHVAQLHNSMSDIMPVAAQEMFGAVGTDRRWGHGFFALPVPDEPMELAATMHWLPTEVHPQLEQHLSPEQLILLRNRTPASQVTIFPNTTWSIGPPHFFFLRTWQPLGPGKSEIWTWVLTHPHMPDEKKRALDQSVNFLFGPTGMIAQDDLIMFARNQRAASGTVGSHEFLNYGYSLGAPNKRGYVTQDGEWPGPGDVWLGIASDDHIWNYYVRWHHLMAGGDL